ncbi:coiled-coil domain-containing protein 33 [Genypterus blacodes]|uniref:coiled-coil domain-containing protein 33 n=1 Tax=Genypterus blacodes TaxID=154954 RepID=UPI003F7748DA
MSKMAEDILSLRTQMGALEAENSRLRTDLTLHQDLGRDLLSDTDMDVMTKAEMADRIASLKFKLAGETSQAASQRDRIQKLQNELIKRNDSEKKLLQLQRVQQQPEENLQHPLSHLARIANLEATVKQQEKVIEKMERALDSKLTQKDVQSGAKRLVIKKQKGGSESRKEEIQSALAAENARLREELQKIGQQPAPIIIQQLPQKQQMLPFMDRLSLLSKLERAKAKIQTLETQLVDHSKSWGRQKQDLLTKLSEHRHGFAPATSSILQSLG